MINMLHNKLIKNNRLTFLILAISAVVSFVILIYVTIQIIRWNSFREDTEKSRKEIETLIKKRPSPGKENEDRMKADIAIYNEKAGQIVMTHPLQPAVNKFFEVLDAPLESAFSDKAEKEKYKVAGTGIPADPKKGVQAVPYEFRKFSQQEFLEFFKKRYDEFCKNDQDRNARKWIPRLNAFMGSFNRKFFPAGNWQKAVDAFVKEAEKVTFEPLDDATKIPLLLMAIGFERIVYSDTDIVAAQEHIERIKANIEKYVAGKKNPMMIDFTFIGGDYNDSDTRGRSGEKPVYGAGDYPDLLFHWDVYGDMVKHLADANVSKLNMVLLRTRKNNSDKKENTIDLKSAVETAGDFKVAHYTIVITGKMSAIRNAVRELSEAVKSNRMYVVRSIFFSAKQDNSDNAAVIFGSQNENRKNSDARDNNRNDSRGKRLIFNEGENTDSKEKDSEQARIEREASLPPEKRSDYGMIYVGSDEECVAYIDVDYVVSAK